MLDTERAALAASLAALERVIEGARAIAPFRGELEDEADRDHAGRIGHLLLQAERETARLRLRIRPPSPPAPTTR